MSRSRRSCAVSSSALSRSWMRSLRIAMASVRSRGSRPRAIWYCWCSALGRKAPKEPDLTALVLPGCAPGLRLGGRDVGPLLLGDGFEAGADDTEGGDVVLLLGESDG